MGTFHSLCARVLRRDGTAIGIDQRFTIYDTDDQTGVMKQVLRDLELQGTGELRPAAVLSAVSRWKNDLIGPAEAATARPGLPRAAVYARAYVALRGAARDAGALDFDDLLNEAVRLFDEAPAVLAHYQERWRYLHVDEYQDTNRAQYLWVRRARQAPSQPGRGGRRRPEHLLLARRGPAQHPRLRARLPRRDRGQAGAELPLHAAHPRCRARGRVPQRGPQGQEAVDREPAGRAHRALRGGPRGRGGRVDRAPGGGARGRPGSARLGARPSRRRRRRPRLPAPGHRGHVPHQRPEPRHRGVVPALRPALPAGGWHPLLPAARGQGRAGLPARAAQRRGRGGLRAHHQRARPGHRRADHRAGPGAGGAARRRRVGGPARRCGRDRRPGHAHPDGHRRLRRGSSPGCGPGWACSPLPELLDLVLEESGYRAMLMDGSQDGEDRWANLLELREVVDRYADLEPEDALDRLLEETALVADQDAYAADADAATLITLHAAKGLEFDVVFIAGLEEGVFPHAPGAGRPAPDGGGAAPGVRRPDARAPPAVPDPRRAARDLGPGRLLGAQSRFLLEIPDGADARSAARGPRRRTTTSGPTTSAAAPTTSARSWAAAAAARALGRPAAGGPVGPRRLPPGGGYAPPPGAPRPGEAFRPSRDLAAKREAYYGRPPEQGLSGVSWAASGRGRSAMPRRIAPRRPAIGARAARPSCPGERRYRDGDRVRHATVRGGDRGVVQAHPGRRGGHGRLPRPRWASSGCWRASPTSSCWARRPGAGSADAISGAGGPRRGSPSDTRLGLGAVDHERGPQGGDGPADDRDPQDEAQQRLERFARPTVGRRAAGSIASRTFMRAVSSAA